MGASPADQRGRSLTEQLESTAELNRYVRFKVPVKMKKAEKEAFNLLTAGFQIFNGRYREDHIELCCMVTKTSFDDAMEKIRRHFTEATEITREDFVKYLQTSQGT